jgi:hypothetical protein
MLNMKRTPIIGPHPSSVSPLKPNPSKRIQHMRWDFYFRLARPWYDKLGRVFLDESGIPVDTVELSKLGMGFKAAFASIGATYLSFSPWIPSAGRVCQNPKCSKEFIAKRSTARFCPDCREDAYALRMLDPKYADLNRERARIGMREKRKKDRRIRELVKRSAKLKASKR